MHLSLLSIFFSLFIILHYKNTSTLLLHLQNNLFVFFTLILFLSLTHQLLILAAFLSLSLSTHTHTHTQTRTLTKDMSSRRSSRSRQSGSSRISDDQISDLVTKLQHLIPELRRRRSDKVSASKVLQETCNYIRASPLKRGFIDGLALRNLHREVDDLSDRLSELLASTDDDSAEAAIIRSLLNY
ncbi:unnamed protein product [Brassica napus]|uniref:(rape) hypothetical protein n=1 Tax=Brassica napus TaxID=3708 RepID=A0A817ACI3_BRANA|nr:unnamed protein product [Brassica napus]